MARLFLFGTEQKDPARNDSARHGTEIQIMVPTPWYQKNGELERRSLSKIEQGGPPGRLGLEAPQEQQGVWGAAAPQ